MTRDEIMKATPEQLAKQMSSDIEKIALSLVKLHKVLDVTIAGLQRKGLRHRNDRIT